MKISNIEFLERCLDALEEKEYSLLIWGIVDVYLSVDDVLSIISELLDQHNPTDFTFPKEVVEKLIEINCLFVVEKGEIFYRSRMAETVRLIFHLRQMFPNHRGQHGWQRAPTLVADYRFIRRTRYIPEREQNSYEVAELLNKELNSSSSEVYAHLLSSKGSSFKLAEFQVRAAKRILTVLSDDKRSGTVISAGTGGGKTFAFYLPVLSMIGASIEEKSSSYWMKCFSLYPRIELLKNQFLDVFREARHLDEFLRRNNKRKILIGALYGDTPKSRITLENEKDENGRHKWRKTSSGYVCPFLKCPVCEGDLVWPLELENEEEEYLKCTKENCDTVIAEDEVILTRKRMRKTPPDILFSTTEMLNQNLSNYSYYKLFGISVFRNQKPRYFLLDEVHTYSSYHGAQVAFLIRRWMNLVKYPTNFVGLSATLKDAERFFSRLTGIYQNRVEEIKALDSELKRKGTEYLLAVKGDPVSQTALLSTTIQLAMVVSRMLDRLNDPTSMGFYGQKIFAFTDDLDVANRLYYQILDVEGRDRFGNQRAGKDTLASLRTELKSQSRFDFGQDWRYGEDLQDGLNNKKDILRVSSQDPGVSDNKDIVVATASLEVGIDDDHVGAVIQHKKPKNNASFIQRKGRAGRSTLMRPWTFVVLSDYGQDRIAYQGYEHLFDPEITPSSLPLESRFIHHIQGVYILMEFLANEMRKGGYDYWQINIWRLFSSPNQTDEPDSKKFVEALIKVLYQILLDKPYQDEFEHYIERALSLKDIDKSLEVAKPTMWDYPRPLISEVIPTIIRRLEDNWGVGTEQEEQFRFNSPLPEFAPSTLFGELNLPEVVISFCGNQIGEDQNAVSSNAFEETMPILKALKTFAPGRVSKRFSVKETIGHWVIPNLWKDEKKEIDLEIDDHYASYFVGNWSYRKDNSIETVSVYRPTQIIIKNPEKSIQDTSNSFLEWKTEVQCDASSEEIYLPKNSLISELIKSIKFYTHSKQCPLVVRRFTTSTKAEIKVEREEDNYLKEFHFKKEKDNVALGFETNVDSVEFSLGIEDQDILNSYQNDQEVKNTLRTAIFLENIHKGPLSEEVDNKFLRDWLANVYLYNLIFQSIVTNCDLETANTVIKENKGEITFKKVLNVIFQAHNVDINEENNEEEVQHLPSNSTDKLLARVQQKIDDQNIRNILFEEAKILSSENFGSYQSILKKKMVSGLAGAVYSAFCRLCPDIDATSIIVDIIKPTNIEDDNVFNFYLSESSPGGIGLVDEFISKYSEDPRKFFRLIESELKENEFELTDKQLQSILKGIVNNSLLTDEFSRYRGANSIYEKENSFKEIRKGLSKGNYVSYHGFLTSLNNRILRPGSSVDSDEFLMDLYSKWIREEQRLGIEIDARLIAFSEVFGNQVNNIDHIVKGMGFDTPNNDLETWRFNVISGLLWPRGEQVRNQHLSFYNPFSDNALPERLLFKRFFSNTTGSISVLDENWQDQVKSMLSKDGHSVVSCPINQRSLLQEVINFITVEPIDTDYIKGYARLIGVSRNGEFEAIELELVEALL